MKLERLSIGTAAALVCASASAQAWNASTNWNSPANPDGVWSYGEYQTMGTFESLSYDPFDVPYEWENTPDLGAAIWENANSYGELGIGPGQISLNSGYATAVLAFTAPVTGIYAFNIAIGGTEITESGGFGNALAGFSKVSVNGTNMQWDSFTNNVATWQFNTSLTAGQSVDAYVISNGQPTGGNTALSFGVNAIPEPASYLAVGIGLIGLIGRRKRPLRN
jgi:hypothetical protein